MATLVLTVVGTALGGPIGAAIGATLGRAIDSQIFAPKALQGPRLSDLRLQTSSYGSQIPKLFGRMRVAGTVIWATDLQEQRHHHSGGKGRPSTNTYTYSASFAVALSARQIGSIGRIWADGNLLRGAVGDFKTGIGAFRVAPGSEDQGLDPLMGATLGGGLAPAHRGVAYAVFENLDLTDFGNRIPSLTFEVIADATPLTLGTIASQLSGGDISNVVDGTTPLINGYAASGSSVGDALSPLVDGLGLTVRSDGASLRLSAGGIAEGTLAAGQLLLSANGRAVQPRHQSRERADQVPVRLTLRHYDVTRDYQAGLQTATRPGPGRRDMSVDMPATMDAAVVRTLAQQRLQALWTARSSLEVRASWGALTLAPGATITIPDYPGLWRIEERAWEDMTVRLQMRQLAVGASVMPVVASSGVSLSQPDVPHGPTTVILAELPGLGDVAESAPVMVVACAGASAGWRRAALFSEDDANGSLTMIGTSAPSATIGTVLVPPATASAMLFDETPVLVVELRADAMTLHNVDDAALAQGANLCLVGEELIQFGRAIQTGPRTFRLEHLLRGRRGTEWAMATHSSGEAFILLEPDQLFAVPSAYVHQGSNLHINAIGIGDATPAESQRIVKGHAISPLSPVHFHGVATGGGWQLSWTRRSRTGWRWTDGADAPLGEEQELYHLEWVDGGVVFRTADVAVQSFPYDAASASADRAAGHAGPITVTVCQIGIFGPGRTASLNLTL